MTAIQNPYVQQQPSASDISFNSGESAFSRLISGISNITLVTQIMALSYFTAQRTESVAFITTETGGTAAAALTYAAVGVYSVDSAGNLTRVGATADLHASLWASTFTIYTSALSASFTKTAGQKYAVAALAVGTTPPSIMGASQSAFQNFAPFPLGEVSGQSTLPASVNAPITVFTTYFNSFQAILSPTATP